MFLVKTPIFECRRFRRANSELDEICISTDSEVLEEIEVGKVFSTYVTWYMLGYILMLLIYQNLENQHLRLGTKRIHVRLIVTIPTIVRPFQGTKERSRIYSLGWVSGRLPWVRRLQILKAKCEGNKE